MIEGESHWFFVFERGSGGQRAASSKQWWGCHNSGNGSSWASHQHPPHYYHHLRRRPRWLSSLWSSLLSSSPPPPPQPPLPPAVATVVAITATTVSAFSWCYRCRHSRSWHCYCRPCHFFCCHNDLIVVCAHDLPCHRHHCFSRHCCCHRCGTTVAISVVAAEFCCRCRHCRRCCHCHCHRCYRRQNCHRRHCHCSHHCLCRRRRHRCRCHHPHHCHCRHSRHVRRSSKWMGRGREDDAAGGNIEPIFSWIIRQECWAMVGVGVKQINLNNVFLNSAIHLKYRQPQWHCRKGKKTKVCKTMKCFSTPSAYQNLSTIFFSVTNKILD
jgi:hypothetical protein